MNKFLALLLALPTSIMAKNVEVYDFETKKIIIVPQKQLGPEMIRVQIDGGKIYWADSRQLQLGSYQHPPFSGELKNRIESIGQALEQVDYKSYAEWEDGFRKDKHPQREIEIWEHMVRIYESFSKLTDK